MAKPKKQQKPSNRFFKRDRIIALEEQVAAQEKALRKQAKAAAKLEARVAELEAATAEAIANEIDDLTKVTGIGRVIERRLQEAGVLTYAQLAQMSTDTQQAVLATLGTFEKRARPDQWVREAQRLVSKRT